MRQRIGFTGCGWGSLTGIGVWDVGYKEPIYLISSLKDAWAATELYRSRFRIETFFSDQKSRGFRLEKSHLSCPERLNRLLIGCVYAYWWLTYLGTYARQNDWDKVVHRFELFPVRLAIIGALAKHCLSVHFRAKVLVPISFLNSVR